MASDTEKFQEKLEGVLKASRNIEAARNAFAILFPKAEQALQTYSVFDSSSKSDRSRMRRISTIDSSQFYFGLTPGFASWGRSEIEDIISSPNPQMAINEILSRIEASVEKDRENLRRVLLDNLSGAFGGDRPFTREWLLALLELATHLLRSEDRLQVGIFSFDNAQRFRWVLVECFRPLRPVERFELFQSAIAKAKDISILCSFFRSAVGDLNPNGRRRDGDEPYFGEGTEYLRAGLLERIQRLTKYGMLWLQVDPGAILWFWWSCDLEAEVRAFTDKAQRTKRGLRALLEVPISYVQSTAGNYEQISEKPWSMLVNLKSLEKRANSIVRSSKNEADVVRAKKFLEALKRGARERF